MKLRVMLIKLTTKLISASKQHAKYSGFTLASNLAFCFLRYVLISINSITQTIKKTNDTPDKIN